MGYSLYNGPIRGRSLRPEGGLPSGRSGIWKSTGISLVELYERVGKSEKKSKKVLILWLNHFKRHCIHSSWKGWTVLINVVKERGTICQCKVMKREPFSWKMVYQTGRRLELGAGASPYKTCWVSPPPSLGLCQRFGNHVEFNIIKEEPILTVENSNELIFFLSKQRCGKAWGKCYLRIPGILGLSPDSSPTGFFRFPIWWRENGAEWQGSSGVEKEAGIPFSEQKSMFIITGHLMTEVYFLSP